MDRALVVGASGGIGRALVDAMVGRGLHVSTLSRSADGFDVTDEESVLKAIGKLEEPFDIVVVATGALEIEGFGPEKSLKALEPAALAAQFALNATGPLLVLKHVLPKLRRDRRAIFAALSARVGSIGDNGLGGWYSYRAAKTALNQLLHTAAIEVARTHPHAVLAALHPGTVKTSLTNKYLGRHPAVEPTEAARNLLGVLNGLTSAESGGFFDWAGKRIPW